MNLITVCFTHEGRVFKDFVLCDETENRIRAEHKLINRLRRKINKIEVHFKQIHEEENHSSI